ncbi:uncharacterized protein [Symphalangus syndactylus]|uniref:uncharacterized protein n=1 Tax=Symphalangus syndactylus TaxID=9590 RepID=UPI002442E74F|nr:uncharacterized protein LOC129491342 [Symphalangus syndactylus]
MQRGTLSPSPSDGPGALGTTYPVVHRGQGMAGLRVPAFNAGLRPITPRNVARLRVPARRARRGPRDLRLSASWWPRLVSRPDLTPRELGCCGLLFLRPHLRCGSSGAGEGAQSPGAQSVLAMLVHRTATHTLRVLEPKKDPQRVLPATHRSWAPARQPSPLHSIRQTTPAKPSLVKRERRNQALAREVPWFPQRVQWKTSEGPGSSSGRRGRR